MKQDKAIFTKPFDASIATTILWDGKVPIEDRRHLPEAPGIYVAWIGNVPIYVGRSINIRWRWAKGHSRLLDTLRAEESNASISWVCTDSDPTPEQEQYYIDALRPTLNGMVATDGPANIKSGGRSSFIVYLPPELRKRLKDEAHRQDKSISQLAGELIERGLGESNEQDQ